MLVKGMSLCIIYFPYIYLLGYCSFLTDRSHDILFLLQLDVNLIDYEILGNSKNVFSLEVIFLHVMLDCYVGMFSRNEMHPYYLEMV